LLLRLRLVRLRLLLLLLLSAETLLSAALCSGSGAALRQKRGLAAAQRGCGTITAVVARQQSGSQQWWRGSKAALQHGRGRDPQQRAGAEARAVHEHGGGRRDRAASGAARAGCAERAQAA
jgi:hypothetical protein